jgi:hypothetical protein
MGQQHLHILSTSEKIHTTVCNGKYAGRYLNPQIDPYLL